MIYTIIEQSIQANFNSGLSYNPDGFIESFHCFLKQ